MAYRPYVPMPRYTPPRIPSPYAMPQPGRPSYPSYPSGGPYAMPPPPGGPAAPPGPAAPAAPSISDQVLGIINPQLQAVADAINRRSQLGSSAIGGLTGALGQLAGQWEGMGQAAYKPEIASGKKVANYSRQALTQAGAQTAADVGGQTAAVGQTGPGDINLAQQGAGAGGAAYGTGIAALDALISKKAAQQLTDALGPSFAAGLGQQNQSLLAAQLARQAADQQSQIMASVPQLTLDLQNQERTYQEQVREYNQNRADRQSAAATAARQNRSLDLQRRQANREATTGYQWEITSTGIRPKRDKNGNTIPTDQAAARHRQDVLTQVGMFGYNPDQSLNAWGKQQLKAIGLAGPGVPPPGMSASAASTTWKTQVTQQSAKVKEDNRHAEAEKRIQIMQQGANTAADKAKVAAAAVAERKRYDSWKMAHPKAAKSQMGTAPRRVGPNAWKTASGKPLGKPGNAFWESLWRDGWIDMKGHVKHPIPTNYKPGMKYKPSSGGSGGGGGDSTQISKGG